MLLVAAILASSCSKDSPEQEKEKTPQITCSQAVSGIVMKGEEVEIDIANISEDTEVTVKFGKEKTIKQMGSGTVSYAFEYSGSKTVTVSTDPEVAEKTSFKIYVENLASLQRVAENLKNDPKLCLVMAHRGNSSDFAIPENSLGAVEKCIKDKVDIMEIDLYTTKDNVLVVSHDEKLERETNGSGAIRTKTLEEIKKLSLKDRNGKVTSYKMLTFDELLDACKGRIYVNVDLGDREANVQDVVMAINKKGMTQQCLVYLNSKEKILAAYKTNPKCNAYSWCSDAEYLVSNGLSGWTYFTQCTWNPTTAAASRTGSVDTSNQPTSRTTVAKAANKGTIITVNAIYSTNTAQLWADDFKLDQVKDIFETFPATRCIHVDTPAEARRALVEYGRTLLNN